MKFEETVVFPKKFSFTENYDESIRLIYQAVFSFEKTFDNKIILSFVKCKKVELCCLFLLDSLMDDIYQHKRRIFSNFRTSKTPHADIVKSKSSEVNKRLCVLDNKLIYEIEASDKSLLPVHKIFFQGQKNSKSYIESRKKKATHNTVAFLNQMLSDFTGYELAPDGINKYEGLISEAIDNAEQHSYYRGEWYSASYFFEDLEKNSEEGVAEVQLHIFNLGDSIFKSFQREEKQNSKMINVLDGICSIINKKSSHFEKSNLYTLLALNQGVSSLHFTDESRGTGTIKLLDSFFEIGDYEDKGRGLEPLMLIVSGDTMVKIDNKYKHYKSESGKINVSLNDTQSVYDPPKKSHLQGVKSELIGTLFSIRIYINKTNFLKKIA